MRINHQTTVPTNNVEKYDDDYFVTVKSQKSDYYREIGLDEEVTPKLISSMVHNALLGTSVEQHGTLQITISTNE